MALDPTVAVDLWMSLSAPGTPHDSPGGHTSSGRGQGDGGAGPGPGSQGGGGGVGEGRRGWVGGAGIPDPRRFIPAVTSIVESASKGARYGACSDVGSRAESSGRGFCLGCIARETDRLETYRKVQKG